MVGVGLNNNFFMQQALSWLVGSCPYSRPPSWSHSTPECGGRTVGGQGGGWKAPGRLLLWLKVIWVTRLLILGSRLTTPIPWPCLVSGLWGINSITERNGSWLGGRKVLNAAETACGVESEDGQRLCLSALLWRGAGVGRRCWGGSWLSPTYLAVTFGKKIGPTEDLGTREGGEHLGARVRMYTLWVSSCENRTWLLCTSEPRGRDAGRRAELPGCWCAAAFCSRGWSWVCERRARSGPACRPAGSPPGEAAPPGFLERPRAAATCWPLLSSSIGPAKATPS